MQHITVHAPQETFQQKLLAAVERQQMLAPGDRVLVALSGGQDSLALIHCLNALREDLGITLHAGHLHHGMRGEEADADLEFLEGFCEGLAVPLSSERVSVPDLARECGISIEEAGRGARYEFLREAAAANACNRIALGHTATDRAETVLMNILRGAGLDGLRGIPAVNEDIIRPLILITRDETAAYCERHGLAPRLDRTNLDADSHLRNRIRLRLLPLIAEEYAPGVEAALLRLAQAAEEELRWTEPTVEGALEKARELDADGAALKLTSLVALPDGLLTRVLRRWLSEVAGSLAGLTMGHVQELLALVRAGRTGARLHLPFEVHVERGYNHLVVTRAGAGSENGRTWQVALRAPGRVSLPEGGELTAELGGPPDDLRRTPADEAYLDLEAAGQELLVRGWQEGDRISPLGMGGSKKLQDIFTDAKVARQERPRVPVVLNTKGEVLWVAGLCVSQAAAIGPQTARCVHLVWKRSRGAT